MKERTLVIAAHFDDIAFAMAGAAAKLVKDGQVVDEAILTDSNGQDIWQERLKEEEEMMKILGIGKLYQVGIKQGFKDGDLRNNIFELMIQAIISILNKAAKEGFPYTRIISFGDDGYTGHLDHKAASSVALLAFERSKTVKELWQVGMSPEERKKWNKDYKENGGYFVPIPLIDIEEYKLIDISETYHLKLKAINVHQSQLRNGGELHLKRIGQLPKIEYYKIIKKTVYQRK